MHDIVFHGKGGYDFHTLYNFPIWLRNFTYTKINDHYEKEKEAYDKASGKSKLGNNIPKGPNVRQPDYSAKAHK